MLRNALVVTAALAYMLAMGPALAKERRCAIPPPELLNDIVLQEKAAKLGDRSPSFADTYRQEPQKDGTLVVTFPASGGSDGDAFVVIVDPCRVEVRRSFLQPKALTGTKAAKP